MTLRYSILPLAFFILCSTALLAEEYTITIICEDKELKTAIAASSQTLLLKEKTTPSALKRRAQNDKEKFENLAHYYGYYSAKITYSIHNTNQIIFRCDLGQKYILHSFTVLPADDSQTDFKKTELKLPDSSDLRLKVGEPISTQRVIDAEKTLLWQLKKKGYAHSSVAKREIVAHTQNHTLSVTLFVNAGKRVQFGPTQIVGTQSVLAETIQKYVTWKQGRVYNPTDIERTQSQLEKTGLFSSVIITEEKTDSDDQVPLVINVQESKHHSIGAGVAYTTAYGPGVKAQWENKNLRGLGDKLTFRTEIWEKYQTTLLSFTRPHFRGRDQDLIYVAEYDKLHNIAFDSRSYSLSALVQTRVNRHMETMVGIRAEWLHSHNFEGSNFYKLLKLPLQIKWSNANNLLDPTKGQTLNTKLTPSTNFLNPSFFYLIHTSTLSGYHSFFNNRLTLAAKVVFGNIMGAARNTIPPPDRFYGGSENVLRGFKAYTVSPLHDKKTPIGGRSILAGSFEARLRTANDFGYVVFYDVGNVYTKNVPELRLHQFHSIGVGLRYATPIGPLRFDVAVPINRRPNIDPSFQIYFSIGQSF